jgi:hypothetical protein
MEDVIDVVRWWAGPGTVTGGRFESKEKKSNSIQFKWFQIASNFDHPKNSLPELQKFEINYGFEALENMNSSLHINFFRFRMDFKWKIQELSRLKFERI